MDTLENFFNILIVLNMKNSQNTCSSRLKYLNKPETCKYNTFSNPECSQTDIYPHWIHRWNNLYSDSRNWLSLLRISFENSWNKDR